MQTEIPLCNGCGAALDDAQVGLCESCNDYRGDNESPAEDAMLDALRDCAAALDHVLNSSAVLDADMIDAALTKANLILRVNA